MPAKTIAEVKDLANYKKVLKADLSSALTRAQPFRAYDKFQFNAGKGTALIIGSWSAPLLAEIQKNSATLKASGRVALQGRGALEFTVTGGQMEDKDMRFALNFHGLKEIESTRVERLGEEVRDQRNESVETAKGTATTAAAAELETRKKAAKKRLDDIKALLTPAETAQLRAASVAVKPDTDPVEALDQLMKAEAVLAAAEQRLGRSVGSDGSGGASDATKQAYAQYATEQERRNKQVDDAMRAPKTEPKKFTDGKAMGDGKTLKDVRETIGKAMGERAEGMAWQKAEVELSKEAGTKIKRSSDLAQTIVTLTRQKADAIKDANQTEAMLKKLKEDPPSGLSVEQIQQRIKGNEAGLVEARKEAEESDKQLKAAQAEKVIVDKWIADNDAEKLTDKHGSGRHGAQTGIEGQARRVGTGGYGADQAGNEYGTSRSMVDDKGQARQTVTWNKVKLTWQDQPDGKRTIADREKIVQQLAIQAETHFQETVASSLFLGPEFEKDAATRALKIANEQCKWTHVFDDQGNAFVELKRIAIVLGKPSKGVGWGTGVKQRTAGVRKMELAKANEIVEQFRNGKINQDQLLASLNSELVTKGDGGKDGVELVPTCMVIVDRTSPTGRWINLTQYPCSGSAPGWGLNGKKVKNGVGGKEETAGQASGV